MRKTVVLLSLLVIALCFLKTAFSNELQRENRAMTPVSLSLDEAILLAVRSNPNVQSTQLNHVSQKFNLWVQEWEFYPHFGFQTSYIYNRNRQGNEQLNTQTSNIAPSVSLQTHLGTQVVLSGANTDYFHYQPALSLQIMQPLMRGFGKAVVEASLNNARDSEFISRLNIESVLRTTVTEVINSYLGVVSAERTVIIDEDAVKRAETSVHQTKLFIKAGHKAGNELVTVEANVASAKTQLENDRNSLMQAKYALLAAIGLDPNTNVSFTSLDLEILLQKYRLPAMNDAKKWVLENDIQYKTDQITLHGQTKRNILIAEDNSRWKLDFTANVATGQGAINNVNNDFGTNNFYGINQSQSVGLSLTIPIYDQQAKQAVLNAKLALQQAELALKQEKWNKETGAINAWNSVTSAERAFRFAVDAEKLQEKTYNVSYQKYLHGLIDSLELQSALQSLILSKQSLLNARINYLRAQVNLDLLVGHTLKTWKINARM